MNSKLNILTLSCGTLLFSTLLHAELLYKDSALQREEVVSLIKQGQVDAGLQNLRQLLMQQPDDQKLIADFVVIAYENKKFVESDVKYLNGIQTAQFPEYGKVNVIKALRDLNEQNNGQKNSLRPIKIKFGGCGSGSYRQKQEKPLNRKKLWLRLISTILTLTI